MGGDGGSIPGRIDLVRTSGYTFVRNLGGMGYSPNTQMKAADEHLTSAQIRDLRWSTCSLSQEPLSRPIMACRVGLLYNKESVIKYILAKKPLVSMQHTKNLKDFKEVKFQVDPDSRRFVCPITRTEFCAANRGVLVWKCGCCVSEKAFKELMKSQTSQGEASCPNCNAPFVYNPQAFDLQSTTLDPMSHDMVMLVPDHSEEGYLRAKLMKKGKGSR
ncbi:Protein RTF2 -like protein [Babesia sp. Xinjiang]|uniref:Protein RTF2 -like protein n=1 Tax=Babesia sp. Xinjiang TaxID=462227 RepID=UPI000A233173|nr:Protein RTF2 -like protein [Babesia sp. Xinjiang]ORM39450.1 Protein RTF2 -like protein [Babesia sp. Xinjiang]